MTIISVRTKTQVDCAYCGHHRCRVITSQDNGRRTHAVIQKHPYLSETHLNRSRTTRIRCCVLSVSLDLQSTGMTFSEFFSNFQAAATASGPRRRRRWEAVASRASALAPAADPAGTRYGWGFSGLVGVRVRVRVSIRVSSVVVHTV